MIQMSPIFFGTHEGAEPRRRGMLDETDGKVRVQDGVRSVRKDRVQSVRTRLDRLCSGRDLDFKKAQIAITVILCG